MSIKTWMKEFYQKKPNKRMSKINAIKHSIKKWEGMTEDNLKKHELTTLAMYLIDENYDEFEISDLTCALCIKYITYTTYTDMDCDNCPLYKKLGKSCGSESPINASCDGWLKWIDKKNPDLMIENLKSLLVD